MADEGEFENYYFMLFPTISSYLLLFLTIYFYLTNLKTVAINRVYPPKSPLSKGDFQDISLALCVKSPTVIAFVV